MRGAFGLAAALTAAVALTVGFSSAGASTKFAYTARIDDNQDLLVEFEEAAQKRFVSVDYQLQGDATSETPNVGILYEGLTAFTTVVPDERGRVADSLLLDLPSSPSPDPCVCGPRRVSYFNLTLTNLTSGKTYRLDPVSRDFP